MRHSLLDQSAEHGLSSRIRRVTQMDFVVMIKHWWAEMGTSSALMSSVKLASEKQFCVMPFANTTKLVSCCDPRACLQCPDQALMTARAGHTQHGQVPSKCRGTAFARVCRPGAMRSLLSSDKAAYRAVEACQYQRCQKHEHGHMQGG